MNLKIVVGRNFSHRPKISFLPIRHMKSEMSPLVEIPWKNVKSRTLNIQVICPLSSTLFFPRWGVFLVRCFSCCLLAFVSIYLILLLPCPVCVRDLVLCVCAWLCSFLPISFEKCAEICFISCWQLQDLFPNQVPIIEESWRYYVRRLFAYH